MTPTRGMRLEHDSLGPVEVPDGAYYGAQTQRAVGNFAIGERRMPRAVIHAYGLLKAAAAEVNGRHGRLAQEAAEAIVTASLEVADGRWDEQFPLSVWQSGSGTQSHMNVNEVIAARSNELLGHSVTTGGPVHPNDHVNMGQSSNDTFPTAMHLAVLLEAPVLLASLRDLHQSCLHHARQWADVVTIGRTHLQDAVPMTVGSQWNAHASALARHEALLVDALRGLEPLALGGTAVGTGLNAEPGFARELLVSLSARTGLALRQAEDLPHAMSTLDPLVTMSSTLRGLSTSLLKLGDDVRLLASGPATGIHELVIPPNEPGSSIMPGKVNPTQAEMLVMVSIQVMGLDVAVGHAGSHGELQLNVMRPLVILDVLESIHLLSDGMRSFRLHCVDGLQVDRDRIADYVARSPMLVTALAPHIGYESAAAIARRTITEGVPLRDAALGLGVDAALYDRVVDPLRMARAEE